MRTSPSGVFIPLAQLSISAPVAFADGVPLSVPFNQILIQKGDVGKVPSPAIPGFFFGIGPGFWLIQVDFVLSVAPATSVTAALTVESGSAIDVATEKWGSVNSGTLTLNSLQLVSYAPLQANNIFAGVSLTLTGTGTAGNVNGAKLMIFQLESLQNP